MLRRGKASRRGTFLTSPRFNPRPAPLLWLTVPLALSPPADPYLRLHATGQRRGSSCPNLQHVRTPNEPLRRTSRFQLVRPAHQCISSTFPSDRPRCFLPGFHSIIQALKGEDMTVYGDGQQTRSFQVRLPRFLLLRDTLSPLSPSETLDTDLISLSPSSLFPPSFSFSSPSSFLPSVRSFPPHSTSTTLSTD